MIGQRMVHLNPPQPQSQAANGLGIASMVLGIIALVFAFLPILNGLALVLAVLGLIFGVIGLVLKGRRRGAAISGVIMSFIAIIISVITILFYAAIADSLFRSYRSMTDDTGGASRAPVSVVAEQPSDAESLV
ncbi:hypothetical protein [Lysinibacter sp. HNR]|uniref:hypothetical protein n=1 Tax=Lysinibacter sp. HNR TaxID=3031408 RepID=UPI0024350603|nr:hypothetical protein [Lysinibacter sp. HNR]WGD37892.1 hypothetical protein FrondiHNR_02975 [Lysinibacter sp. HNR]